MGTSGAPSPMYVYVDGNFGSAGVSERRKRLLVTSEHISWRGESMKLSHVTALAYYILEAKAPPTNLTAYYNYSALLRSGKQRFDVILHGKPKDDETYQAFVGMLAALRTHVEPRLIREILARIDHGEQGKVGHFRISREGLHYKGLLRSKFVPWSATFQVMPSLEAMVENAAQLRVYAKNIPGDSLRKIGEISAGTPNSVLAPALMDICIARYQAG
jgi:hypothetical protein